MKTMLELITTEMEAAFEKAGYDKELAKVTLSNRPDLCEYQCNGAMAGAKKYKKAPFMIAEDVAVYLKESSYFETVEVVKPGFINLKLAPQSVADYLNQMSETEKLGVEEAEEPKTIMIDYGGPNVAKPLHVGHLRSAIIGESVKRITRFKGNKVIGDIHLGDWGYQMGLIITELKKRKPELPYFDENFTGEYPAEALRLLFIGTHYHQPFNFTFDGLKQAKTVLDKFYNALLKTADIKVDAGVGPDARVMEALCDDLNTPLALSVLHELVNTLNKAESAEERREAKSKLVASAAVLGLLYQDPESWFKQGAGGPLDENEINHLIEERALAKKEKNYARADEIRNQLKSAGIVLEDTPSGTTWKKC